MPEITRLYKRFKTLDRENRATVSRAELLGIPELAMNPLAHRILSVFDESQGQGLGGDLNFRQFLSCLSAFSPAAKRDVKLKCTTLHYVRESDIRYSLA